MGKRKTPKKDRIVDLSPKPEKIESQELIKLQSLIKGINKAQAQIGMIEVQKHSALHDIMEMRKIFKKNMDHLILILKTEQ